MEHGNHHRIRRFGFATCISAILLFAFLLMLNGGDYVFAELETLRADFRTTGGLHVGSPVQLTGVQIGRVSDINFVKVVYECDPLTEDIGRYGAGRTNHCDERLFCGPSGLCADLEPFAGKATHTLCYSTENCRDDEICVTGEFRRSARKVPWPGPTGVCAVFQSQHWRAQVLMDVVPKALSLIRIDAHASIASQSVLGNQLVSISPGRGDLLADQRRILTRTSLPEDIAMVVDRVDRSMENSSLAIEAVNNVLYELRDPRTVEALQGLLGNLDTITQRIAHGDGLIGALFNHAQLRQDTHLTLQSLRATTDTLSTTAQLANNILHTIDTHADPALDDMGATLAALHRLLGALDDPANKSLASRLLFDREGHLSDHAMGLVRNVASISTSVALISRTIDAGEGTLGRLVNDPALMRDIALLLSGIASHDVFRVITLFLLQRNDYDIRGFRDPAAP